MDDVKVTLNNVINNIPQVYPSGGYINEEIKKWNISQEDFISAFGGFVEACEAICNPIPIEQIRMCGPWFKNV